jgi:hypothetical protein
MLSGYLRSSFCLLLASVLAGLITHAPADASASATTSPRLSEAQKAEVKLTLTQNTAYEFVVNIDLGTQRYRFVSFIPDFESADAGLNRQRALMGWKGDYLFVRHQCGQMAEWRCIVDQVFTRDGGKLVHLGAVESASCKELGCRYQPETGLFGDLYDVYRVNPVTGDTDVPPLPIVRRVKGTTLASDLAETWRINQTAYQTSLACINQVAQSGFAEPCAQNQSPWSALAFAAKLTHYTNRTAEREALFGNQAVSYCKHSADPRCQWRAAGIKDFFQRFEIGASPIYVPSRVTLTSTAEQTPQTTEKLDLGRPIRLKL